MEISFGSEDMALFADRDQIIQVLTNLLTNAIKFSPTGGMIYVKSCKHSESVEIRICDSGPGVEEEMKTVIFEKFSQIMLARSRREGTGLGLAISKSIVEGHGGSIGVDSREGIGSEFWFTIPLQRAE